jgi:hypothetical protein
MSNDKASAFTPDGGILASALPTGYLTIAQGVAGEQIGVQSYVTCFDNP